MKKETKLKKTTNKALKKQKIEEDRLTLSQEIGYLFRPLALCPFPARQPKKITVIREVMGVKIKEKKYETKWERKNGKIKVKIIGDEDFGIPYGQDVLIVLYLAKEAVRQQSRYLKINFYRDFCRTFEIDANDGRKYRLVQNSLNRIRNAHFVWVDESEETRERESHYLYIDDVDLFFDPKNPNTRPLWGEQTIKLSERFWNEIIAHKIPFNLESVRYLKSKPAYLNFYIWLSYRVWSVWNSKKLGEIREDEKIYIPFWGENGLQSQLSSQITRKPNYREQVIKWLEGVKEIWGRCPVEIDGDALVINVVDESELDILETVSTEGKRYRLQENKKAETKSIEEKKECEKCGKPMVSKKGRKNRKGFIQPDYWHCSHCKTNTPKLAVCPSCNDRILENQLNGFYYCKDCKKTFSIEKYWNKKLNTNKDLG